MVRVVEDVDPHRVVLFILNRQINIMKSHLIEVFSDVFLEGWLDVLSQASVIVISDHCEESSVREMESHSQLQVRVIKFANQSSHLFVF